MSRAPLHMDQWRRTDEESPWSSMLDSKVSISSCMLFLVQIGTKSYFVPFPSVDSGNADKYICFKLSQELS